MGNDDLSEIVGGNNVLDSPEVLEEYSGDMSFVARMRPRCVVKPGNTQEVQEIVKWANETGTPLVPVSSGAPHFHGGTVPKAGGAVMVDLTRMKKIINIDPGNRVAMVEPGLTFAELQPELAKHGLSAYMPLSPRASKSVVGSMLEREPVTMPAHHWDSSDPFLCAEVIFGTGDAMRTGEAAGPQSTEEKLKAGSSLMTPFGLSQFDENKLISGAQGTIGIITWATLKCRVASKFSRTLLIPSDAIEPLIEMSYKLLRTRQSDNLFILNGLNLACLLGKNYDEIQALREVLPLWVGVVSFEGNGDLPEDKVAWMEGDFRDIVQQTSPLKVADTIPGANADEMSRILAGPSDEPYWKLRDRGGCADLFFLTTLDRTPRFVNALPAMATARRYPIGDVGVYIQPIVQGTSCHCEFNMYYDPAKAADIEKVKSLVTDGAGELANLGAFFSRPYGYWARIAYGRATESAIMLKKVKKIFDPKDVLNPGQLCF
ncbi:MAG: FAD-binding oxidoreductase [Syntrophorhabdales bacterium]|jgi:FAD/FMN-containing dehydrogenase